MSVSIRVSSLITPVHCITQTEEPEYFCDIEKAFQDRENYCYPDGFEKPSKKQLLALKKEWADYYIDQINYPEEW